MTSDRLWAVSGPETLTKCRQIVPFLWERERCAMADQPRKKAEDALLLALACGASVDQAARQCGLSSRTVYRRLAEPDFRRRLQALRGDMVSRTAGTLTAAAGEAVRTLLELLKSTA